MGPSESSLKGSYGVGFVEILRSLDLYSFGSRISVHLEGSVILYYIEYNCLQCKCMFIRWISPLVRYNRIVRYNCYRLSLCVSIGMILYRLECLLISNDIFIDEVKQ